MLKVYKCANKLCKWQGDDNEKKEIPSEDGIGVSLVCPKCENLDFFELLDTPPATGVETPAAIKNEDNIL